MICHHGVVFAVLFVISIASAQEEEPTLKVSPSQIAARVGESAEFECTYSGDEVKTLLWLFPNETSVNQTAHSRFLDSEGKLTISDVMNSDEGEYVCTTPSRDMNATGTLKIFVMPSYFTEAMIVMGINIVLVLIFIGCGVNQYIQTKKEKRNFKKSIAHDI